MKNTKKLHVLFENHITNFARMSFLSALRAYMRVSIFSTRLAQVLSIKYSWRDRRSSEGYYS